MRLLFSASHFAFSSSYRLFYFFCLAGECIEFCEFRFGLAANIRIQGQMTSAKHFCGCRCCCFVVAPILLLLGELKLDWHSPLPTPLLSIYCLLRLRLFFGFFCFALLASAKNVLNICTAAAKAKATEQFLIKN